MFASANRVQRRGIRLAWAANGLQWNRIAVSPVRSFKTAVNRNREKRVCREAYRAIKHRLRPGYDLALILYPGVYTFHERREQLRLVLRQAGLLG